MSSRPPQTIENRYDDDEIDLFELFQTLWNSKFLIIACIIFGLLIAGIYAYTAKEQWKSEAYITYPRPNTNFEFINLLDQLNSIKDKNTANSGSLQSQQIFDTYILNLESLDNQNRFINKAIENVESDKVKSQIASTSFEFTRPKNKDEDNYKIELTTNNPELSQKLLKEYIEETDLISTEDEISKFNFVLQSLVLHINQRISDLKLVAESAHKKLIYDIEKAISIAKKAGIKQFSAKESNIKENIVANNNDGSASIEYSASPYLFLFGEDYLQAMLSVEKSEGLAYPNEYYELERKLTNLKSINTDEIEVTGFSYQLSPTLPGSISKPKRTLIMLIGAILGGMLGVFWVLLRDALRKRKAATQ